MTMFIIVCISLSLMGSVLWILPSQKDRQRMVLRLHARKLGLNVKLTSIDLPDKWDKSITSHKVVAYSLYRDKPISSLSSDILFLPYSVWKYHELLNGWWVSGSVVLSDEIQSTLKRYSASLEAIRITDHGVTLFWLEKGSDEDVERLSILLSSLRDLHQ